MRQLDQLKKLGALHAIVVGYWLTVLTGYSSLLSEAEQLAGEIESLENDLRRISEDGTIPLGWRQSLAPLLPEGIGRSVKEDLLGGYSHRVTWNDPEPDLWWLIAAAPDLDRNRTLGELKRSLETETWSLQFVSEVRLQDPWGIERWVDNTRGSKYFVGTLKRTTPASGEAVQLGEVDVRGQKGSGANFKSLGTERFEIEVQLEDSQMVLGSAWLASHYPQIEEHWDQLEGVPIWHLGGYVEGINESDLKKGEIRFLGFGIGFFDMRYVYWLGVFGMAYLAVQQVRVLHLLRAFVDLEDSGEGRRLQVALLSAWVGTLSALRIPRLLVNIKGASPLSLGYLINLLVLVVLPSLAVLQIGVGVFWDPGYPENMILRFLMLLFSLAMIVLALPLVIFLGVANCVLAERIGEQTVQWTD